MKARDLGAEIFTASAATGRPDVAELGELNRRRDRLIRNLGVYEHGPRELAIELATRVDGLLVLEELARRFADGLDPDLLRVIGWHDFPCSAASCCWREQAMKAVHPSAAELPRSEDELSNRFSFAVVALARRAHPEDLAD